MEIIDSAVEDAKKNAESNALTNTTFVSGKAEEMLSGLIEQIKKIEDETPNDDSPPEKIVAVLDPPRAGLRTLNQYPDLVIQFNFN